jgi:hypothetical protein
MSNKEKIKHHAEEIKKHAAEIERLLREDAGTGPQPQGGEGPGGPPTGP